MVRVLPLLALSLALGNAQGQPPPPGQLVNVEGHRVHIYCTGQGHPAVIIIGAFSVDWALVQPEVAAFTRICTYDVAGTAWSEPGPARTCADRVTELHTLLHNAEIKGPYVLAGLSIGGLISRFYAREYAKDVAGIVFIDHAFSPDPPPKRITAPTTPSGDSPPELIESTPILLTTEDMSDFNKLPENIRELHRWAESRKPALNNAETADDCEARLNASQTGAYPLGNLPLVVVSTGNQSPGYSRLQKHLLSLSRNSQQIMADRSFHSVEIDQPEVVVKAVRQTVEKVRQAGH